MNNRSLILAILKEAEVPVWWACVRTLLVADY